MRTKHFSPTGTFGKYSLVTDIKLEKVVDLTDLADFWFINKKALTDLIDEKLEELISPDHLKPRT